MKKLAVLIIMLAFLFQAAASAGNMPSARRLEGDGYDSPEEAVLAYIDAMNRGDVGGMLSTFALESYAAHADPLVRADARGLIMIEVYDGIPCADEYARSLVAYTRYGSISKFLLSAYIDLSTGLNGQMRTVRTSEERREIEAQFTESPLNGLQGNVTFVRWISPVSLSAVTPRGMGSISLPLISPLLPSL